jgi:mono/diheme cytochrome c family protein
MTKPIVSLILVLAAATAWTPRTDLQAQAGRSTAEGVYTEAQAKRGQELYQSTCAACHGPDLQGMGVNPPLNGPDFDSYWRGKQVGELFEKISMTMPKTAPGSLTPDQSADAIAYILSMLKSPAGATPLPAKTDDLNKLTIEAAKP